ncbi:MAG: peptidase C14 [Cyanobacteria bacterium CRU_2_1]|nr:peptidase C14 [Cyanobacteria bacterium CRU_2_1]
MSRDVLVVGINTYTHLPSLSAPAVDAEAIAQRLAQDGDFHKIQRLPEAIDRSTQKPVVAKKLPVSQIQLEQALEQLFLPKSQQAPETALFYFSGHGIPDSKGFDKGYLATSDTDPRHPRSGISLHWLQWLLSGSPVKQQIIWLDCCHSGSLLVNVAAANPGHGESRDRCFVASSRDFESSWEDLNSSYSVLTKALLDGLDPNRLPGRWIDTFALVDYINQALKGELQTPVCTNFGEAINLTRTWQVSAQSTDHSQTDSGICPYKGLEFFDCNDEDPKYFFGRDRLIGQLLDHVRTHNFLALVGASGNGKSSVLRAGLLHQLQLGRRIAGSDRWRIRMTRPDRQPMQNLALAFVDEGLSDLDRAEALGRATGLLNQGASGLQRLVQASTAPRVMLVIDQFEEVFTRCDSIEEREQFFACLMGALSNTEDKLCLIIAMRADFVGKCFEQPYSGLAQQIQQHLIPVLPMEPEELRAAIGQPAEQVGLEIEPALVTEMLNDIAGAPGSLPLLQYTLKQLWQQRQGNQLTLSTYQALGGINGTLDQRATAIYNSFEPAEQRTVQHIFQQLTQLGEGTEDTRRRVFQADLVAEPQHPAAQVQMVIDRLSSPEHRLLVTSEVVSKGDKSERRAIVDVAHEALIRHWNRLRHWIEQNRDRLRQQRKIEASAIAWRDQGRKSGYLLQGLPLTEAIHFEKQQRETFPLSDSARMFIQQSLRHRRWNRVKTASWLIIPALVVVGVVEHNLREDSVKADYARLEQAGKYEEKQAVEALVQGCDAQQQREWLLPYLAERLFGNCRSLVQAPLANADLRSADLRTADLRFTPDEASAFLNHVMGLSLTAADIAALEERTEGWIAGLQLAAISMQSHQMFQVSSEPSPDNTIFTPMALILRANKYIGVDARMVVTS